MSMGENIKYKELLSILRKYKKIGIAFSGGVDSTLLLYAAKKALGEQNVVPFNIVSRLNSRDSIESSRIVFKEIFPDASKLREIRVDPMSWTDFVINSEDRCYVCKKRMYTTLTAAAAAENCSVLADGTNVDDLQEDRPGLRAVRQLGVVTPLVDAGLKKGDIRKLAREFGLTNFDLPSNSCLATRIQKDKLIDVETLGLIGDAEHFLQGLGFNGCRVRILEFLTLVEVQTKDLEAFVEFKNRVQIEKYFKTLGYARVVLSLEGR